MDTTNSGSRVITIVVVGAILIAGGIVMALLGTPLIFPTQASAQAESVDNLFKVSLAISGAIFLLVQGVLLVAVFRYRADPNDMSDAPHIHGNTTLEIIWTAIPAVIVIILSILAYAVWTDIRAIQDNEQVVHLVGQRFNWSFRYEVPEELLPAEFRQLGGPPPSPSGEANQPPAEGGEGEAGQPPREGEGARPPRPRGFAVSSPDLHTYVGRPVHLMMNSPDVIHSFWVPAMRIKQDLLPGRETDIRFTPIEAGEFRVVCAELCGDGHGQMGLISHVIVHEDEAAYNAWLTSAIPPIDGTPAERGRQLLDTGGFPCSGCHTLTDLGWEGQVGPNLNGIGDRAARRVPGLSAEEYLTNSLLAPDSYLVAGFGNLMPQFETGQPTSALDRVISPEDLHNIVQYLLTQTG